MPNANLGSLSDKPTLEELTEYVLKMRKELQYVLSNMDSDNVKHLDANQMVIENLVVGSNVIMGPDAVISWGNVGDKPFIPQTAADVGALSTSSPMLTYIDSTGVYTGTLVANQIIAGTISADRISGGTISGVNINVSTDVTIGNRLNLSPTNYANGINWGNSMSISTDPWAQAMHLDAPGGVYSNGSALKLAGSSTQTAGGHNHGIANGTVLQLYPSGTVTWVENFGHTHTL